MTSGRENLRRHVLFGSILEQLNPDTFVTGDGDQAALAVARGFRAVTFY